MCCQSKQQIKAKDISWPCETLCSTDTALDVVIFHIATTVTAELSSYDIINPLSVILNLLQLAAEYIRINLCLTFLFLKSFIQFTFSFLRGATM